uniref:ABM domain-containing protein n=1 Tax=Melopsittacus undulatus TaxID=13146 RepID=A0A8V5FKM8_MELUD
FVVCNHFFFLLLLFGLGGGGLVFFFSFPKNTAFGATLKQFGVRCVRPITLPCFFKFYNFYSTILSVSIQKLQSDSRFIVYEFWENSNAWNRHLQMNYSKTFQRSNVDFLETPEIVTTMLVPASWWVLNNN